MVQDSDGGAGTLVGHREHRKCGLSQPESAERDPPRRGSHTRFDLAERTLRIAVTELLEEPSRAGLGFRRSGGMGRLWLGQALHARFQAAAAAEDPSYQKEVSLQLGLQHAGWEVHLHGRADGIRESADGALVVEEIKSVGRGAATDARRPEVHRLQVALYAWMAHLERGLPVRAELLMVEIGSGSIAREAVQLDFAALEETLRTRIDEWIERFHTGRRKRARWRNAAERVRFPYSSLRRGQEQAIEAVETALEQGEQLLLQATTGIGKTIAVLFPALRFALANDKRLYFLTPKTLQQDAAMASFASLGPGGVALAVRLRAKAGMCASPLTACHEESCEFARDFGRKLRQGKVLRRLLGARPVVAPETLYEIGVAAGVCPFELSLLAARESVATVCDYNYAFDPLVSLPELSPDSDRGGAILVIDEIHNLVDRAREIWSPSLEGAQILRAEENAALGGALVHREVEALCRDLRQAVDQTVSEALPGATQQSWSIEHALPAERLFALRGRLDAVLASYLEYRFDTSTMEPDDPFLALCLALLRLLDALAKGSHGFAQLVERTGGHGRLRLLCTDPGERLAPVLERSHAVIGLSATLTSPQFHRDLLGMQAERCAAVAIPNPFPQEHQRVVIDASVSTRFRDRTREAPRIARRIAAFADRVPGHCLALFPSHAFLAQVAEHLPATANPVLRQAPGDELPKRLAILAELRDPQAPPVLLLATAGGVFAEGIDLPGSCLRAVAVVGPCPPPPDLERELLASEYEERFGCGFDYAYAIPGMTRVVQGAGRLIRSQRDTGVVALLGRRFLREPYRGLLPEDWLGGGLPEDLVGDPAAVAQEFFAGPLESRS